MTIQPERSWFSTEMPVDQNSQYRPAPDPLDQNSQYRPAPDPAWIDQHSSSQLQPQRRSRGQSKNYDSFESMEKSYQDNRCLNNNNNCRYSVAAFDDRLSVRATPLLDSRAQRPLNGSELNGNVAYDGHDVVDGIRPRTSSFDAERHLSNSRQQMAGQYQDAAMRARQRFQCAPRSKSVQNFDLSRLSAVDFADDDDRNTTAARAQNGRVNSVLRHSHSQQDFQHLTSNGNHVSHVVHDGYATMTRSSLKRQQPVRASHNTGLARVHENVTMPSVAHAHAQSKRTVVLPQQPISSQFESKILRMLQQQQRSNEVE